jgi:hypothetical protein
LPAAFFPLSSTADALHFPLRTRSLRSSILSTEVSFGCSREACGRLGYMNVRRRRRSGPGERKLEQLSTESNRRSPRGSSSVYL